MMLSSILYQIALGWLLNVHFALAARLAERRSSDRLVVCHFIMGIMGHRNSSADYDADMISARDAGIDAFALNIGVDRHTDAQLDYAYESAAKNDMKVFISFDFTSFEPNDAATIGEQVAKYAKKPAQLKVKEGVFVSSFVGDGLDVAVMRKAAKTKVFFIPNFEYKHAGSSAIDGAFNWQGWPNDGHNKAPSGSKEVSVEDGDKDYQERLGDKPYMAPVSPWFSTHFGEEAKQSKNWVFPSGSLIFDRWNQVLAEDFQFVELVSWNDYGESHYIGPLSSPHLDDGNSKWTNDMPHDGWLQLSKPFIAAYKARSSSVNDHITDDKIVYWYRRTLASLDCDDTDPAGRPNGYKTMPDKVYVATLLKEAGSLTVKSGDNSETHDVSAGANLLEISAAVGKQSFSLTLESGAVLNATSLMEIEDVCPCGLYNFNAYVGSVPPGPPDHLLPEGLKSLTKGLQVSTCSPTPTLGEETQVPSATATGKYGQGSQDAEEDLAMIPTAPSTVLLLALTWLCYEAYS